MEALNDLVKPRALDEAFGELMDESAGALPQRSRQGWREGTRRRSPAPPDLASRVSRLLMHYLSQFCMVDLYGAGGCSVVDGARPPAKELERGQQENHRRQLESQELNKLESTTTTTTAATSTRWPWWPRAIRCIYSYCTIKALVTLYYQYCYDFNLTRYERLRAYLETGGADSRPPNFYATERRLQARPGQTEIAQHQLGLSTLGRYASNVEHAKWMLGLLGAPYMQLRFSIECSYIFFLLVSLALYIQTQLFFTYVHPFDFALVRSIMDFRRELRSCNKLIRWQLNKFIESSRVFTCTVLGAQQSHGCQASLRTTTRWRTTGGGRCGCATGPTGGAEVARALENHSRTIEQIERMALSGALVPANKQHAWVRRLANANCLYTIIFLTYCIFIGFVLVSVLPSHLQARLELSGPMDFVTSLESLFLVLVVNLSSTFWGSIVLATSLDQVHLVRELKLKFERTVRVNIARFRLVQVTRVASFVENDRQMALAAARFAANERASGRRRKLVPARGAKPPLDRPIRAQMDNDLLELLLSYKIFVAQLEPLKRSYGFVTLTTCTLMILMPVIGRVHVPYVDGRIKLYVGGLSLLCTVACDLLILIPVSYLYSRSIALHKSLSSLLAHTVEVSQVALARVAANGHRRRARAPTTIGYNEHTVFALRKELRDPGRLVGQFATTVLGVRLTYSNLLKIHFWIGFITQSFLFESSGAGQVPQDLFGSIFADPLGLR